MTGNNMTQKNSLKFVKFYNTGGLMIIPVAQYTAPSMPLFVYQLKSVDLSPA